MVISTKFTLKEWVKHPTTILLFVVSCVAWGVLWIYVESQLEQVNYLKERVTKLETQLDNFTNTILFKEAKEKAMEDIIRLQRLQIDSLKGSHVK